MNLLLSPASTGFDIEDGKYKIRIRIEGRLIRRTVGPVGTDTRRAAQAILAELQSEAAVAQLRGTSSLAVPE